jgi:hypothetical protein
LFAQSRWPIWALPTLVGGLIWVSVAASVSLPVAFPVWIVAVGLLSSGGAQLVAPGDHRITQIGALAGLLGTLVSLPLAFAIGLGDGLLLAAAAIAGAWGAGRMAMHVEPFTEGVPAPEATIAVAAKVAGDELILGFEQVLGTTGFALDGSIERVVAEIDATHALFAREGFLEKAEGYHVRPPDLTDPEIRVQEIAGHRVEMLRFESGYAPADGEPGRDRWLGYDACRDGWAYVLRHEGPPRPWLIATNGYRMGHARIDIGIFERFFHEGRGLGLNVLIPVLPLHGPRRLGWHSGSGFMGIDVIDTIHAETQSLWDMRRLLSWIQTQDAPAVGAFGLSLGGLTTANFASLAEGLSCAVPGIPLVDISRIVGRHSAKHQLRYAKTLGFDRDRVAEILRVINPLWLSPRVPLAGRMMFAGTADRLVTPDHVRDLWRHWEEPEIVWYQGSHISFLKERAVWAGVDRVLRENGLSL